MSISDSPTQSLPNHASATSTRDDGASPHALTLPNFCNLGVTLRLLLGVNLLMLGAALVKTKSIDTLPITLIELATFVELALIASIVVLCPLKMIFKSHYWLGVMSIAILELVMVSALWLLFRPLFSVGGGAGETFLALPRYWLLTLGTTGLMLYYFALRDRALSPALDHARLQALQARIRPHFLFNSLTAVLSLIRSEPRRAEAALEDLADLVRVLMRDQRRLLSLGDEIDICKRYLAIETLRLGTRLTVVWDIDEKVLSIKLPPLILQPMVENAVHHGIEPATEGGTVAITIAAHGRREVHIDIINPHHTDAVAARPGNHMALSNVRERLKLHFDIEAKLTTEIVDGHYRLRIVIPTHKGNP